MLASVNFRSITKNRAFSEGMLQKMEEALTPLAQEGVAVVINGSYARLEASAESDIDYFLLVPPEMTKGTAARLSKKVASAVVGVVGRPPAEGGVFSVFERVGSFARTIGGEKDDNPSITRRILFLTEGRAALGKAVFDKERDAILKMYVRSSVSDHQLGQFLLNDIIRFYRTMCVDFENKTVQGGKPWGIRNIKLVFSRKMLYFGGVLICAELAQRTYAEKIGIAKCLMAMTPIERLIAVCGGAAERALKEYDYFLGEMAKEGVRDHLQTIPEDRNKHSEMFKSLKNRGHKFTMCLISALRSTYPESHPIHRSLIM